MTEQTTPEIPDYADLLRRAAAVHASEVTAYTVRENALSDELTRFRRHAETERQRIENELAEARAKAETQLNDLAAQERAISNDLREAGLGKTRHQRDADGAQRSWLDWCQREGIDPRTVPPLPTSLTETSQPLPAAPPVVPPTPPKGPAWMAEQDRAEDDEDRTRDDAHVYQAGPLTTRADLPAGGAPDGAPFRPGSDGGGPDA
ncbi:hypothetical protein ACQEU3_47140 [Spirillospora sp. CA-253888]